MHLRQTNLSFDFRWLLCLLLNCQGVGEAASSAPIRTQLHGNSVTVSGKGWKTQLIGPRASQPTLVPNKGSSTWVCVTWIRKTDHARLGVGCVDGTHRFQPVKLRWPPQLGGDYTVFADLLITHTPFSRKLSEPLVYSLKNRGYLQESLKRGDLPFSEMSQTASVWLDTQQHEDGRLRLTFYAEVPGAEVRQVGFALLSRDGHLDFLW